MLVERGHIARIAREINVSPSYMSKIVNGHRTPSLRVASRLAKSLGISIEELNDALSNCSTGWSWTEVQKLETGTKGGCE